jgi:hypothetical protein
MRCSWAIAVFALTNICHAFDYSTRISEFVWNPVAGANSGQQYFEIEGPEAGEVLPHLWMMRISTNPTGGIPGVPSGTGVVLESIKLPTITLGRNAVALIKQTDFPLPGVHPQTNTYIGGWTPWFSTGQETVWIINEPVPNYATVADIDLENSNGISFGLPELLGAYTIRASGQTSDYGAFAQYGRYSGFGDQISPYDDAMYKIYGGDTYYDAVLTGQVSTTSNGSPLGFTIFPALSNQYVNHITRLSPGRGNENYSTFVPSQNRQGELSFLLQDLARVGAMIPIQYVVSDGETTYQGTVQYPDTSEWFTATIPMPYVPGEGPYTYSFFGSTFLRTTRAQEVSSSWGFASLTLINGDVDQDNEVGPGDFELVISQFGGVGSADCDHDGEVGPGDFEIVVRNFGRVGD